jgi:hypothetical protein
VLKSVASYWVENGEIEKLQRNPLSWVDGTWWLIAAKCVDDGGGAPTYGGM